MRRTAPTSSPTRPRARRSASARCRSGRRSRSMPSSPSPTESAVDAASVAAVRSAVEELARRTPMLASLGEDGCRAGVVAASAGNPGQALAAAARQRGVHCEVFMPTDAPLAKVEAARGMGAEIHVGGDSVDECIKSALARADEGGLAFVHPFDDTIVVSGQGSLGLELLEDVPDLAKIVVPVGGGGLCAGVAIAVKSARPEVEVVGVQVAACAPYPESLRLGAPMPASSALTIADGIAVKSPGELTLALLKRWADEIV